MALQPKHQEAVMQAHALIQATITSINVLLEHPDLHAVRHKVVSAMQRANASIQSVTGVLLSSPVQDDITAIIAGFKPLDSVGGIPLNRVVPVAVEDLHVSEDERALFLQKRDDLYSRFAGMADKEIFALTKEPNGAIMIRSVAKRAGHPAYREGEITTEFLQEVREKIHDKGALESTITIAQESGVRGGNAGAEDEEDFGDDTNARDGAPQYNFTNEGAQ